MDARSEGDETPLWLDAHACQEARSGGINASGLEVRFAVLWLCVLAKLPTRPKGASSS